jgi:glutamate synthase domain-containing protein 3
VLGTTGRNFAAGMSGGVAYVLDEDGAFASRCNAGMVELSPLAREDEGAVHALVTEHVARTGSAKGKAVLAAWAAQRARFVKVLPLEYKKVLASRQSLAPEPEDGESARSAARSTPKAAG